VELTVALVIALIFSTIVFQLIQGQGAFVATQTKRQEVQQNARGALDIITGELRGVPVGALIEANDHDVTFMLPRAWGIVCATEATSAEVLFPSLPADLFAVGSTTGLLVNTAGDDANPTWEPAPGPTGWAKVSTVTAINEDLQCDDLGFSTPAGVDLPAYELEVPTNFPAAAAAGQTLTLYQVVKYDLADDGNGLVWMRRSMGQHDDGTWNQQPLAGPVPDDQSLVFTYYDVNGAPLNAAPGADAGLLASVHRIGVALTARSTSDETEYEREETVIHLRN
jgi:type II secretory pathway pseudopilin PulG